MEQIVFLDRDSIQATLRRPGFQHEWRDFPATSAARVADHLEGATIAISNKVLLQEGVLKQLPKLRLIAVAATGTNNVDLEYCRTHGIAVCNVRGYSTHSVAEHTFAGDSHSTQITGTRLETL